MKREVKEFIDTYLAIYVHSGIDELFDFFKYYSSLEIFLMSDLKNAVNEFCDYLKTKVSIIKRSGFFTEESVVKSLESFKRSISVSIDRYLSDDYKNFSQLIFEVSPNKQNEIILDVGAGRIPSSSIWLSEKVKSVTSMDNEFYLSRLCLKNMRVDSVESYFNGSSDVSKYSFEYKI